MAKIKLSKREWYYHPKSRIGDVGGFGRVFTGTDISRKQQVAVKKLHNKLDNAGHRELDIAKELLDKNFRHVMMVLDFGIDANTGFYFFVMPKAEKSLQDVLNNVGQFIEPEAIQILVEIVHGLLEIPEIVHRDLKPANVLFHDGVWKISDFGLARLADNTTSTNTVKEYKTYQYAAPEQWELERATSKTDIYSLGCIAYELVTGELPFKRTSKEEYKQAHMTEIPNRLPSTISDKLSSLIMSMLSKAPDVRPIPERVLKELEQLQSGVVTLTQGKALLESANVAETMKNLEEEAKLAQGERDRLFRERTADAAILQLDDIINQLFTRIHVAASVAKIINNTQKMHRMLKGKIPYQSAKSIMLGDANLTFYHIRLVSPEDFKDCDWDVIAGGAVVVEQSEPASHTWGANFWFTNLGTKNDFRWYEIPYHYWMGANTNLFAVNEFSQAIQAARSDVASGWVKMAVVPPCPIDGENTDSFFERYETLLALAYQKRLPSHFRYLPIQNYCSGEIFDLWAKS